MLTLKQAVEQDFQTNWATTAVHIYGYNTDVTGLTEYIKIQTTPLSDEVQDTAEQCKASEITVEIFCYAETLHRATELSDLVVSQLRAATAYDVRTAISYDNNELDAERWMLTVRATAYLRENVV